MAIAYDTTAQGKATATNATLTISITPTGSNNIALIGVADQNSIDNVTGVTYDGNACTKIASGQAGAGAYVSLWYYLGAPASAKNVVISRTLTTNALYGQVLSFSGAKQSAQPDNSNSQVGTGNVTSRTCTLTTVADNSWGAMVSYADNGSLAASTNSTLRGTVQDTIFGMFDNSSIAPITPTGSTSMAATCSSGGMGAIMASFSPFVVSVGGLLMFT